MMTGAQFWEIIAFFGAIVIFIPVFYRLKLNPLLAFICAGVVLGPHVFGLIKDINIVDAVGQFGLLFLMFSIGLDLSFNRFKIMRLFIFGYGGVQFVATALVFGLIAYACGRSVSASIIIGCGLSMSSTAVAARLMGAAGTLNTPSGRVSVGILLLQDLAIIPLMFLLPRLADNSAPAGVDVGTTLLKAVGAITLVVVIGRALMKPLFRAVVATQSNEAFTALIFFVFLCSAWLMNEAGLSISLGAFLGGMLIAETQFVHEVEAEISPVSSLLLGVFFLYVGLTADVGYAWAHFWEIALITVCVMTLKFSLLYIIERCFKLARKQAVVSGAFLCQAGEFGFVIFNMASMNFRIMSEQDAVMLQVVIALSMVLTPFVANFVLRSVNAKTAEADDSAKTDTDASVFEDETPHDHVIIIGYGDIGQAAAQLFARAKVRSFIIEDRLAPIEKARKSGRDCLFGNANSEKILRAANLAQAKAVVITPRDANTSFQLLRMVRMESANVPVFVHCDDLTRRADFAAAGATGIVSQSQECGIRLAVSSVTAIDGEQTDIIAAAAALRREGIIGAGTPDA